MNSLDGAASFSEESENDSERNSGENLKNNPYFNSGNNSAESSNGVRISKNKDKPLIKLTNIWKIYQMVRLSLQPLKE